MPDIRDGLKVVIEGSGMKKKAVAQRMGLTDQQLTDIFYKRRKLDANELVEACKVLNVRPDVIFAASDVPEYDRVKENKAG
jgi:transcriptional regulator with XRE-family HTH domain